MRKHIIIAVLSICGSVGCIVEFVPDFSSSAGDILVVEGTVTDGETIMSLHTSLELSSSTFDPNVGAKPKPVGNARVWVESEAGGSFSAVEMVDTLEVAGSGERIDIVLIPTGRYSIATGTLDDNTRYRVRIESAGEEYVSEWRAPQHTPGIDEVDFHAEGNMVQVRLDVTGEADGARNYMWSYQETWETQASVNATHYYARYEGEYVEETYNMEEVMSGFLYPPVRQFLYPGGMSPFRYCWKYNKSQQVLIADTKRLSDNSLRDHVLFEFGISDDRLSALYHLRLNQWVLGDDAFLYFNTLQDNTDNTGSIFAPIPSEMKGNLVCLSSPDIHVIGFVEVSHVVTTELYVHSNESPYIPTQNDCDVLGWEKLMEVTVKPSDYAAYYLVWGADPQNPQPYQDSSYARLRCIDCRVEGGTKTRPDWWPNGHY